MADNFEQLKTEIMEELTGLANKEVKTVYDGKSKFTKVMNEYDKILADYSSKKEYIAGRYAEKVCTEKLNILELDLRADKIRLEGELDDILKQDKEYKKQAIANLQSSAEYKSNRKDVLNIIALAGNKLNEAEIAELIKPLASAKDGLYLSICNKMLDNPSAAITAAKTNVDQFLDQSDVANAVRAGKDFIRSGKTTKPYQVLNWMNRFK